MELASMERASRRYQKPIAFNALSVANFSIYGTQRVEQSAPVSFVDFNALKQCLQLMRVLSCNNIPFNPILLKAL